MLALFRIEVLHDGSSYFLALRESQILILELVQEMLDCSHPVARAVLAHAAAQGITPGPVEAAQSRPGLGASGNIDGVTYHVGNMRYLAGADGHTLSVAEEALLARHEESAGTVVAVWSRSAVLGFLNVEDTVRPQARAVLDQLKEAGIGTIIMLTGDSRPSAEKVARETGVTEVRADLLPEDKTRAVSELAAAGRRVAMVGDGVNDAPALASSHLGVAMGPWARTLPSKPPTWLS